MTRDCAPTFYPQAWLDDCAKRRGAGRVFRGPWLTVAMLGVFIGVFALEQRLAGVPGVRMSPRIETLLALGALNGGLVRSGEWFRLLTATFLHASPVHILGNGIAFALAGYGVEWLVGRAWMFCLFSLGALAGWAVSLAVTGPGVVAVGASGGIMALLTALFMLGLRLEKGRLRRWILIQTARTIVPAVIPHVSAGTLRVDYGAHMGGAALGLVLGGVLWLSWRNETRLPPFRGVAGGLAVLLAAALGAGTIAAAGRYPHVPPIATASVMAPGNGTGRVPIAGSWRR